MPLQATSGAASYDAFGGGVAAVPVYIEDTFSTFVYAGNSTNRSIVNDIDLSGKGGLVWIKDRNFGLNHTLFDTARGATKFLSSDNTNAEGSASNTLTAFNSNGFNLGTNSGYVNGSGYNYVSWTFRKQPKFFDVVTWTSTNNANARISHNLGSAPGCYIIKRTDGTGNWFTYHTSLGRGAYVSLNATNASASSTDCWGTTNPTSTDFGVNETFFTPGSGTYVAYLFAHDAGGFGLTGTDNVISCGSYTEGASAQNINLGYEPQWLMLKRSSGASSWFMHDTMRGMSYTDLSYLEANTSAAEASFGGGYIKPTATGFIAEPGFFGNGSTVIYIAIRRGPMKVPTSGTSVFSPNAVTMTASGSATITTNFPVDLSFNRRRSSADQYVMDRLRGGSQTFYNYLRTQTTGAETTGSSIGVGFDSNTSLVDNNWQSGVSSNTIWWSFRRAPSFFDEVCYTGTGSATTQTHNLGAVPELMIVKRRSGAANWPVYSATSGNTKYQYLNSTLQADTFNMWNNTTPTASVFSISGDTDVNGSGSTYVAYLFATCAGVSKCGTFTGNGSSQTINCGFTGGARFVMIKATSTTGDWMVADSARGIVAGSDPYLELNNTNAEVTGEDWLDTDSTGFVVNQVSASNANTNGVTYIFLAIA